MDQFTHTETLMGFAGLAISLIGFTGIVIIFADRSRTGWSKEDVQRFVLLVSPSLTVFFGAFLPIVLAEAGVDATLNWRISNGVFGVVHFSSVAWFVLNPIKAEKTKGQNWNLVLGILAIAGNFAAAAGLVPWLAAIYLFGMVQQLWISIFNFLLMLKPQVGAVEGD